MRRLLGYVNSKTPLSSDPGKDQAYRRMYRQLVSQWRAEKGAALEAQAAAEQA